MRLPRLMQNARQWSSLLTIGRMSFIKNNAILFVFSAKYTKGAEAQLSGHFENTLKQWPTLQCLQP